MGQRLPDIELGMRGHRFQIDDDGSVVLIDPVFVIDGQRRLKTVVEYVGQFPADNPARRDPGVEGR